MFRYQLLNLMLVWDFFLEEMIRLNKPKAEGVTFCEIPLTPRLRSIIGDEYLTHSTR